MTIFFWCAGVLLVLLVLGSLVGESNEARDLRVLNAAKQLGGQTTTAAISRQLGGMAFSGINESLERLEAAGLVTIILRDSTYVSGLQRRYIQVKDAE